jgi:hypothetical protein
MGKHSTREAARYGTPLRTHVRVEVNTALLAIGRRTKRTVGHVANLVLEAWHKVFEDEKIGDALEHAAASNNVTPAEVVHEIVKSWYREIYLPAVKKGK